MSEHYTRTSFLLNAAPDELKVLQDILEMDLGSAVGDRKSSSGAFLKAFPPINDDPVSGYVHFLEEAGLEHAPEGHLVRCREGVAFVGEYLDLGFLVRVLQRVCTSCLPISFSWADTCSRSALDEFGGGCVLIERDDVWYYSALLHLHELRAGKKGGVGLRYSHM